MFADEMGHSISMILQKTENEVFQSFANAINKQQDKLIKLQISIKDTDKPIQLITPNIY